MLMRLWSSNVTRHEWGEELGGNQGFSFFSPRFCARSLCVAAFTLTSLLLHTHPELFSIFSLTIFPICFSLPCRGDVQSDGGDDELLHTAGPAAAAAGRHGSERLQHGPVPTGAHPPTDARGPHEPIWWASTKNTHSCPKTHTHTHTRLSLDQPHSSPVWDVCSGRTRLV